MAAVWNGLKNLYLLALLIPLFISGCSHECSDSNLKPVVLKPGSHITEIPEDNTSLHPYVDRITNLYGYKNRQDQIVIPAKFHSASKFTTFGLADVSFKQGLSPTKFYKINKQGDLLVQVYFFDNGADYYINGRARYIKDHKIGFIDVKGQEVIPARFDWASPFNEQVEIALVCQGCKTISKGGYHKPVGGKWGAIDTAGKVIVPFEYSKYDTTADDEHLLFYKNGKAFQLFTDSQNQYHLLDADFEDQPYRHQPNALFPSLIGLF